MKAPHHRSTHIRSALTLALSLSFLTAGVALAQNDSGGTALWDATTWSNTSPDRLDGVSTTTVADINDYDPDGTTRIGQGLETLGSGETVQIVGSDTITIDNTITGIAASADTNGQSTGMGGTGYAETSGSLSLGASTAGTGTITMTGGRLDVGMANGGIFLQGSGDANAGTIDTSVGVLSVDGNYRDVSAYNSVNNRNDSDSNDADRQYYISNDVYDATNADAAGSTGTLLPLHYAGGSLDIGNTDDGNFTISGGELNVVQYGWGWASEAGGSDISWEADGSNNDAASGSPDFQDGGVASDATFDANTNSFEGYSLDYATGAYVTGGAAERSVDTNNAANYMYVDAESLENTYTQTGSTNTLSEVAGTGEGDFQFIDPDFNKSWSDRNGSDGDWGPFADYTNEGLAVPGGSVDGELVDHYHQIVRTGGNINVGSSGGATGTMNISGTAQVTTNNIVVGNLWVDDAGVPANNTTGVVNMSGGDVFTRESVIVGRGEADNDNLGSQGTFNHTAGKLEMVNDLVVGNGGDGVVNFDANATGGADATTHIIIGDDILMATGRFGDATINYNGTANILSSEREGSGTNNIVLGTSSYGGNSSNISTFNYNQTAGTIGDQSLGNKWDNVIVGSGWGSAGEFNHENDNTIFLDQSMYTGRYLSSMGATYIGVEGANTNSGGVDVEDNFEVGEYGRGIVIQGESTTVTVGSDGTGTLIIGQYGNVDAPYQWINGAGDLNRNDPYLDPDASGRADPSIPVFDTATTEGVTISQADIDAGHSVGIYEIRDNATLDTPSAYIGKAGIGYLNYDSTQDLEIDTFVQVGGDYTGYGELNITSDSIAVNFDTDAVGNNDFITGRSGEGVTNIDGTSVALNVGANNNIVIGSAATTETDIGNEVSFITDAGDGTFNLNGAGSSITQGTNNNIILGTGDNVSEGIEFREQANNTNLIDMNTSGDPTNIMNPFAAAQNSAGTAEDSGQADSTLLSGTLFGTKSTSTAETLTTGDPAVPVILQETDASTDNTVNWVAGPDDGKGSLGEFNHNNDWNPTFDANSTLIMANGDNSQGLYNQNGVSTVTLGATGGISMSADGFDTGNAALDAPNAAALAAATAGSAATQFEMGQSTYSVNNASAVLNLNANDITGDSVDASGRGAEVTDTYANTPTQGNLQNRSNEAQINLLDGAINNSRNIKADVVQYGGSFDMDAAGVAGFVTTDLRIGNHDFIQMESGTSYTDPSSGLSTTSSTAPTIAFDTNNFDGLLDLDSNISASTPKNSGTVNSDTLMADYIRLNGATGSIDLDFSALLTGSDYLGAANGQYWNLLDWNSGFSWTPDAGGRGQAAFDFGLGAGVLPTLGLDLETGEQLVWSIDESATSMPDLWSSHGIIYIALDISYVPEPSSTALLGIGLGAMMLRRRRS